MIDNVYLDGQKLPTSTLAPSSIGLSALIDTVRWPSHFSFIFDLLRNVLPGQLPHSWSFGRRFVHL